MPRTCAPHQRVLEAILDAPMDLIADIFNSAIVPNDKGLAEIRVNSLALRVDTNEVQLVPATIDDFSDAQVELATHDHCVRLASETVEEVQADTVNLVVHIKALDVCPVVFHDDIDELVDRGCLVSVAL